MFDRGRSTHPARPGNPRLTSVRLGNPRLGAPRQGPGRVAGMPNRRRSIRAFGPPDRFTSIRMLGLLGRLAVAGLFAVMGAVLAWPAPAGAHAALVRTSPVQGSVVPAAPAEITITFSEHVTAVPDKIKVIAPDGADIAGRPTVSGAVLHIPVRTNVPRGTYLVSYRVISADSHPVGAGFSYSVGAPSATAPRTTAPGSAAPGGAAPGTTGAGTDAGAGDAGRTDPAVAIAMAVAHDLGYAGLVLVAGPVLMLVTFWPRRLPRTGPIRLAYTGLGLLVFATLLELHLQVPYGNGGGLASTSPGQFADVLTSRYGVLHLIRLGVLLAVALLIGPHLAGRTSTGHAGTGHAGTGHAGTGPNATGPGSTGPGDAGPSGMGHTAGPVGTGHAGTEPSDAGPGDGGPGRSWPPGAGRRSLLIALGVVGVATWGMAGHPGASAAPALTVIADTAHLAAASVWLGGLVILVGYLLRRADATELRAILPVWSNWAMTAVAVLVLAGVTQALVEVGSASALVHTTYGRLVLLKAGVLAAVLVVAAFSRRLATGADRARGGTAGGAPGVGRLRRSVLAELLGAVVILGLASALVQTPPARPTEPAGSDAPAGAPSAAAPEPGPYSATLTCDLYQLQIEVDPAQTGDNDLHLYAFTPQGAPLRVVEWRANAALPARGVEPVTIRLRPVTDSHATGQITLPTVGTWRFSFTLRTTEIDEATVSADVNVS